MSREQIPFVPNQSDGYSAVGPSSPEAVNVLIDGDGVVRRRPGMQQSSFASSPSVFGEDVVGLHAADNDELFAIVGSNPTRDIYRVTASGSTNLSGIKLRGTKRPVFAETEAMLVIAAGETPVKVVFPGIAGSVSDLAGAVDATHVIANSSRLLTNSVANKGRVEFSDQAAGSSYAGHEMWQGEGSSSFFEAEARPDRVMALGENTNEVWVFGRTTTQIWLPDAQTTYAPAGTRELGMSAPYSAIKKDQRFAWLDHLRRFVTSDGRSYDVLSDPIQQTLNGLSVVEDCFGFCYSEGGVNAYVWVFPTEGRTFVYQLGGGWSEWKAWSGSNWVAYPARSHFIVPGTGENLIGTSYGQILRLTRETPYDYGGQITARVTTGLLNRKTNKPKQCRSVLLRLRRGADENAGASSNPVAWLRWRDRPGPWQAEVPIDLGDSTDTEIVVPFRSLGTYRTRQWGFEFSDNPNLELVGAEEEFYETGAG
jgi:hypothetical protein